MKKIFILLTLFLILTNYCSAKNKIYTTASYHKDWEHISGQQKFQACTIAKNRACDNILVKFKKLRISDNEKINDIIKKYPLIEKILKDFLLTNIIFKKYKYLPKTICSTSCTIKTKELFEKFWVTLRKQTLYPCKYSKKYINNFWNFHPPKTLRGIGKNQLAVISNQ